MFTVECRCTTIWNYELRGNCFESQAEIFMEGGKRFSLVSFGRLMFFFFFLKKIYCARKWLDLDPSCTNSFYSLLLISP